MINGKTYDFESIKINLPSGMATMCEEISYSHEKEYKTKTDTQGAPIGGSRGEFKGDVKLTLERPEFETHINQPAAKYGGIYNMPPLPVVISYGNTGQEPITDKVEFKVSKVDPAAKKGDTIMVTVEGPMTGIPVFNNVPAFTPGR